MDTDIGGPDAVVAAIARHLERGEPLAACNDVQEALARFPGHARLRELQALALARSGDAERANVLLEALHGDGAGNAETLGLLARTHKDLALAAGGERRASHLESSFELYRRGYEDACARADDAASWYTGINAATVAVMRGDIDTARRIAAEVSCLCSAASAADSDAKRYWRTATLAETALILGDPDAALRHYAEAWAVGSGRHGDLSSTRRQAKLLARELKSPQVDLERALAIPPVVIFTGHMVDRADRAVPRFTPADESRVSHAVRGRLAAIAPIAVYASAAAGSDLLCLEAARDLAIETHVVLPFPSADFRRNSVDFAGGGWCERFERALASATSVTVTSDHAASGSAATFDYANLVLTGMGALRARLLDAPLRPLAVWDGFDERIAGGTASLVSLWRRQALDVDVIDVRPNPMPAAASPRIAPPAPAERALRHELRAMLFADAVGYSKLSEDQIPGYIGGFLGAVADLSRRTAHPFEHVETSGDGLYMVFRDVAAAGAFALELNALARGFDRAAFGLPADFNLRIALHCGPVHCARDPITGLPIYTGPHTSRAARIEPITPPGQVYASSAFAAVAAATGCRFEMAYVGPMPLAKSYGKLALYHLRAARA